MENGIPDLIHRPKEPLSDPFQEILYQQAQLRAGKPDFEGAQALLKRISEIPPHERYALTTWFYEFGLAELACLTGETDSPKLFVMMGIEKLNDEWSERVNADPSMFPHAISAISEALHSPVLPRFPNLQTDLEESLCLSCSGYLAYGEERLPTEGPPFNQEALHLMSSLDEILAPVENALKAYRRRSPQTAWSEVLLLVTDRLCEKLAGEDLDLRCVRHLTMSRLNRVMGDDDEARMKIEAARGLARTLFPALSAGDLARGYAQCELPEQAAFLCREFWEGINFLGERALAAFQDPFRAALWCFRQRTQVALSWNDMASHGSLKEEPRAVTFERSDRIIRDIVWDASGVREELPRRVILLQVAEHCISGGQIVGIFLAIQALMNGMVNERRTAHLNTLHQQIYAHLAELLGRVGHHTGFVRLARHVKRCVPEDTSLLYQLASVYLSGARNGSDITMDGEGNSDTALTPIHLGLGNNL